MAELKERIIGAHRLWVEEPDIIWAHFKGTANIAELDQMIPFYEERFARSGPFFLAADVSSGTIDGPGRKHLTERLKSEWFLGTVYIGAGVIQRAATKAISIALLFSGRSSFETGFADDEQGARAWVAVEREKWAARTA